MNTSGNQASDKRRLQGTRHLIKEEISGNKAFDKRRKRFQGTRHLKEGISGN